jgi:AraC-like DNA-binding protein
MPEALSCGCPKHGSLVRAAGHYRLTRSSYLPSCNLGVHAHADDRIVLTLRGEFRSKYGSRTFALDGLRGMYRPAEHAHTDEYDTQAVCISIGLPSGELQRADASDFFDDELAATAWRISDELDANDAVSSLAMESLSAQVIGLLRSDRSREEVRPRWLGAVREWVSEEYACPPSLDAIATTICRDKSYVATAFKRQYRQSIGDYVRSVKLWRARRMLEDASLSLSDVAQFCGYADQSHFGRQFKECFAITPAAYRRRATKLSRSI